MQLKNRNGGRTDYVKVTHVFMVDCVWSHYGRRSTGLRGKDAGRDST